MDVGAAPSHAPDAGPAEEVAFYRAAARHVTEIALRLADEVETAFGLGPNEKAEAVERLARVIRRNALLARRLREPLGVGAPLRRGSGRADHSRTSLAELPDAELEALEAEALETEALERLESLEQLEDVGDRPAAELLDESCRDLGLGSYADLREGRSQPGITLLCPRRPGPATETTSSAAAPPPARHPDPPLSGAGRDQRPSGPRFPARNQDTS